MFIRSIRFQYTDCYIRCSRADLRKRREVARSCVLLFVEIAVWKVNKDRNNTGKGFSEVAKEVVKCKVIIRIYVLGTLEAFQIENRIIS